MSSEAVNAKAKDGEGKNSKRNVVSPRSDGHQDGKSPTSLACSPTSQRATKTRRERDPSKEATSRRKSKKNKKKSEEPQSKKERGHREDSTDGKDSYRQRKNTNSADKGSGEASSRNKRSGESTDKRSSRREKNRSGEKLNSIESKIKRILSGEKLEAPKENKEKPICSETIGYGPDFRNEWLQDPRCIEFRVEPPKKVPMLKVSKTLIIYEVPEDLSGQIEIGDILHKFNNLRLTCRDEYTKQLAFAIKNPDPQVLAYTILRPIRTKPIPEKELGTVVPPGFEILPDHFDYLDAFLIIAPKTILGMTIKGYNGKVYVSGIENHTNSIAHKCLLVGDAILEIEDQVISGVKDADDSLCNYFGKKKFVRMIIERAKTAAGLRQVKLALSVEKTFEMNPRMTEDVVQICEHQISFMNKHPDLKPDRTIFKQLNAPARSSSSHIDVAREAVELPIATDVNNITLLAPTPPVPTVTPGTKGFDPLEMTTKRILKRVRSK